MASLAANVEIKIHAKDLPHDKGIFPYSFPKSIEHMSSVTSMPPKLVFYDAIQQKVVISDEQYDEGCQVWIKYGCKNLLDYMLITWKLM